MLPIILSEYVYFSMSQGLVNGTIVTIKDLRPNVIMAEIVNGSHSGPKGVHATD